MDSMLNTLREWSKRIGVICADPAFNYRSRFSDNAFGARMQESFKELEKLFPLYAAKIDLKWEKASNASQYHPDHGGIIDHHDALLDLAKTIDQAVDAIGKQTQIVDKEKKYQKALDLKSSTGKSWTKIAIELGETRDGAKAFYAAVRRYKTAIDEKKK